MNAIDKNSIHSGSSLFVVGAGLGRTGTASLKLALEKIYGAPCYHMFEVRKQHSDHTKKWVEIDKSVADSPDGKIDPDVFHDLFKGYCATVDYPSCAYYYQLMNSYPESKIVLTVRDPEKWLESVRATICRKRGRGLGKWGFELWNRLCHGGNVRRMSENMWKRTLGKNIDQADDQMVMDAFEAWNARVIQNVPPERLLVFNVKDGWKPLCSFLGVPVPDEPFPFVNQREEALDRIRKRRLSEILLWSVPIIIAAFTGTVIIMFTRR